MQAQTQKYVYIYVYLHPIWKLYDAYIDELQEYKYLVT